jgi:hypothetical protein
MNPARRAALHHDVASFRETADAPRLLEIAGTELGEPQGRGRRLRPVSERAHGAPREGGQDRAP